MCVILINFQKTVDHILSLFEYTTIYINVNQQYSNHPLVLHMFNLHNHREYKAPLFHLHVYKILTKE